MLFTLKVVHNRISKKNVCKVTFTEQTKFAAFDLNVYLLVPE